MADPKDTIKDIEADMIDQMTRKTPLDQGLSGNNNSLQKNSPFAKEKPPEYKTNPLLKTLRTYQGDIEDVIHQKNESVVSIATAEQKHREEVEKVIEKQVEQKEVNKLNSKDLQQEENEIQEEVSIERPSPRKEIFKEKGPGFLASSLWLTVGSALILTGIVAFGIVYIVKQDNKIENIALENTSIQWTSKKDILMGAGFRQDVLNGLSKEKLNYVAQVNSVLYTKFLENTRELSIEEFFKAIAPTAPESMLRAFKNKYMAGVYSFDTNEVFIVLHPDDYGVIYSGMLKWEDSMQKDLLMLFPNISKSTFNSGENFIDDIYKNNDVRVLRNDNNEIVLIYGFVDKKTLIITANERVFGALVSKYINSKIVR